MEKSIQKTIVFDHDGQKVVSQPFTFKHACIMDDARFRDEGLSSGARLALHKMFEGTIVTGDVIDTKIDVKEARAACNKIINWFFGVDEEVKNSSSPEQEEKATGA